ncbi:hypothetical protein [Pseudomonas putida]|uniref:Uncharacterized protein n=1 Tax=Pseudomonas putida TaxID=303 RepID=A0A8I1EAS6_PSEPU|nr:hypothetical protein [Pseudomonas putida]MBI6883034.1 hypothetical protein [Pseudomonas putida]
MSHPEIFISNLIDTLNQIQDEIVARDDQPPANQVAHQDLIFAEMAALERAIGPIFSSLVFENDQYQATMTKSQASFLSSHLCSTLMLITAGLKTRLSDHQINRKTDEAIDNLISQYGPEDYPATVKEMLAKGRTDELKTILVESLKSAAALDAERVFTQIADLAIARSSATSDTSHVLSMFKDVVEVGIGGRKTEEIVASTGPEKSLIGPNVIQVNFGGSRSSASPKSRQKPAEILAK